MSQYRSITGHTRIKGLLAGAVARGSVPPTLLFTGPAGIGKFLMAQATASALNCLAPVGGGAEAPPSGRSRVTGAAEAPPSGTSDAPPAGRSRAVDACGVCRSCTRIARGAHVDVLAIEPDERASIKIDVVREMLDRTSYRPFEGRRRVVIIRDADALEPQAQNALLKSLEEPPPSTIFILTTAVPGVLLPTVRSRCMRLGFGRLTESEVAEALAREAGMAASEARAAAALADGSVGQALALRSTDLAVLRELAVLLLRQGGAGQPVAARLQAAATIAVGPKKERPREEVGLILRFAASMLRDIELLNAGGDTSVLANPVMMDDLSSLTRVYRGDRARDAFGAVDRAIAALARNAGPKVVADWIATQL